jgi:phage terminase small subunit
VPRRDRGYLVGRKYAGNPAPTKTRIEHTPVETRFWNDVLKTLRKPVAIPVAPAHLTPLTRAWWRQVHRDYTLEPHHSRLLTLAAEAWDRCEAARRALGEHGVVFTDRFGCPRARPEVAIERDSGLAFARLIRELDLDAAPPATPMRPPALVSNRGY